MSKKRGNGEGTIYFSEKLNRWVGQFTAGTKDNGSLNRKTVYGKTRKEVAQKIIEKQEKVNKNMFVDKSNVIFKDLCKKLIDEQFERNEIKQVTYKRKLESYKVICKMSLADMKIQDIQISDINSSLLSIKNYSNSVLKKVNGLINTTLDRALLLKIIYSNPYHIKNAILLPKSDRIDKKVEALTTEEQTLFLEELQNDYKYKDVFYIALYTGMRIGEILALTNSDIDLSNKLIHINKTLTKNINDKVIVGTTTKTYNGLRDIPIIDNLIPILEKYQNTNDYLFTYNKKLIEPSTINSHFKRICKNANIQVINTTKKKSNGTVVNLKSSTVNTHMLRHTFATRCIENGMSAIVLQKILGHKNIEITLNTYTSVFNKFKQDEINKINEYFKHFE